MISPYTSGIPLSEFKPIKKRLDKRALLSITLEITARCNNLCRHCYINLPRADKTAAKKEMTFDEICRIIDDAVSLGALWCTITGGEPLLRDDFADIYLYAKKSGLLTSIMTNATLINPDHITLFKKYPPRHLEVSVYGLSKKTYETITRVKGTFKKFKSGIQMLRDNHIPMNVKAPALKSNFEEYEALINYCIDNSSQGQRFQFDPMITLRSDADTRNNRAIENERLSPDQVSHIINTYFSDDFKKNILNKNCIKTIAENKNDQIFGCNAGKNSCEVTYDGIAYPCGIYSNPDTGYDLRDGSLADAWHHFFPKAINAHFKNIPQPRKCTICERNDNCLWCPALEFLEKQGSSKNSDYICSIIKSV